jgi:glycosyltransferase involved in cell wall biosynthesis
VAIRIAVIITGLGIGGAEMRQLTIAKHIDRSRFEVDYYVLYDEDNRLMADFRAMGYRVEVVKVFDYSRHFLGRVNYLAIARLVALLRRGRYDIVHTQLPQANTVGRLAAKAAGVRRIIGTVCDMERLGRLQRAWDKVLGAITWKIMGVSQAVVDYDRRQTGLPASKYVVVHNGIDIATFNRENVEALNRHVLGIAEDSFVVGSIGRLHPQKDLGTLLRAFSVFLESVPSARLLIVGDGEERSSLALLCENLGIEKSVVFTGFRLDTARLLTCFDVFVLSSVHEGLSNVVIQAMSMKVPVVATRLEPTQEIITDGENGYLFPTGNVGALADTLIRCHSHPEETRLMAEAGQGRVRSHFSHAAMVGALERLYSEAGR